MLHVYVMHICVGHRYVTPAIGPSDNLVNLTDVPKYGIPGLRGMSLNVVTY